MYKKSVRANACDWESYLTHNCKVKIVLCKRRLIRDDIDSVLFHIHVGVIPKREEKFTNQQLTKCNENIQKFLKIECFVCFLNHYTYAPSDGQEGEGKESVQLDFQSKHKEIRKQSIQSQSLMGCSDSSTRKY